MQCNLILWQKLKIQTDVVGGGGGGAADDDDDDDGNDDNDVVAFWLRDCNDFCKKSNHIFASFLIDIRYLQLAFKLYFQTFTSSGDLFTCFLRLP